jgi:hypothetical protein
MMKNDGEISGTNIICNPYILSELTNHVLKVGDMPP